MRSNPFDGVRLKAFGKLLGQAGRMLVGMPDYDNYVEHMRNRHPDQPVMSYEAFFRERQQARYGGGKGRPVRCC
jgi:uncharacterized short protein YbdD (DUF466 family)